jgi:hypothetical protein
MPKITDFRRAGLVDGAILAEMPLIARTFPFSRTKSRNFGRIAASQSFFDFLIFFT